MLFFIIVNFGNENEENQEKVWESIKSMIRGMPGSPVRRGKKSNLPASVNVVIDQIGSEVAAASEDYFNSLPILQAVLLRHGKSGGGRCTDGGDYADIFGSGGLGGGGHGGRAGGEGAGDIENGQSGVPNTGGGGGGAVVSTNSMTAHGGRGGSGIIVIRYEI